MTPRRLSRPYRLAGLTLALLVGGGGFTACEDPVIIVGDLPGIMRRAAGVPDRPGTVVDSLAYATQLDQPRGLAVAEDGTLYIADSGNGRIVAVSASSRTRVLADDDGCSGACLVEPTGLALAPDGSLWIADPGAHRVFRLDPRTGSLEVRAGTGTAGDSPDGVPAVDSPLRAPAGIALTTAGLVYFSEYDGHRIRAILSDGRLHTLAGTGEPGFGGDGGPAAEARLHGPRGLALHGGTLYVADEQNDRVRSIGLPAGVMRTVAGNGIAGYAESDTIARLAKLNRPRALAFTPDGEQLFIADALNHRVRMVDLDAGRIRRFAGTGEIPFSGEGLDAADTALELPAGIVVHPSGTLFIADTGHHVVWRTPLRLTRPGS